MSDADRDFWLLIRRALMMICAAIEKRCKKVDKPA